MMTKSIYFTALLLAGAQTFAQPKVISQAMISTKTIITAPEAEEDMANQTMHSGDGEERRIVRFGGEGETQSTTYLKNDWVKTVSQNDMGKTTIFRDNANKKTTTIMEIMGRKTGFYATDEEQEQMRKQMDSLMQARGNDGGLITPRNSTVNVDVAYVDETKKIAGYNCKKALLIATKSNGNKDTSIVWYNPDIKLQGITTTGSMGGFGGINRNNNQTNGLAKINGFVMQYEAKLNRGRVMSVEVTKLALDKEVNDKEFEIPKNIDLKPLKEMQNGGGIQIRIGG